MVRVRGLEASKNQSTHEKTGEDQELTEDLSTFNRGTHRVNRFFFISFYFCLLMLSFNIMGFNSNMSEQIYLSRVGD